MAQAHDSDATETSIFLMPDAAKTSRISEELPIESTVRLRRILNALRSVFMPVRKA